MGKWIQMIRKLFSKRPKIIHPLPKEKVEEESEEQKDCGEKQENLQSTCSQEILLSVHRIYEKHAECSENLLREITKLTDIIENTQKTNSAEMQSAVPLSVSQASAPAQNSFCKTSSFFSSARIRLPPLKKLQHSRVESSMISNVDTDDVKPSHSPKLAWVANQCCKNTEEIMLTENSHMNDVELQTVDVTSTEDEAIGPMIDDILNEPLDEKTHLLEMKLNANIAEWSKYEKEEKVKLKLEIYEAKQREQKEIEELKLKVKFLDKEAKREKQEEKKKLKDLKKEIKIEKSKLLLELKELKNKLKMEEKEERNRKKMEKHTEVDEEEQEAEGKQALKSTFITFKFRSCNGRKNSMKDL
ncbi:nucleolar protein 58-like [Trichomycterus rosablanca]|uniref:nucleolar protein 58-like n=1 Tax=Trichomycterus rosablanca TaxID=2290929 RepID=UPI002F355E7C